MKTYWIKFEPDGRGRARGWCPDEEHFQSLVASNPAHGFHRVDVETYNAQQPHNCRFDLGQGVVQKINAHPTLDKDSIAGNAQDSATLTWKADKPLNICINGMPLDNNPHKDGLVIVWDHAARLHITISDLVYHGEARLRVT